MGFRRRTRPPASEQSNPSFRVVFGIVLFSVAVAADGNPVADIVAFLQRLAPIAGDLRPHRHFAHRRGWLLRSGRLQRSTSARTRETTIGVPSGLGFPSGLESEPAEPLAVAAASYPRTLFRRIACNRLDCVPGNHRRTLGDVAHLGVRVTGAQGLRGGSGMPAACRAFQIAVIQSAPVPPGAK